MSFGKATLNSEVLAQFDITLAKLKLIPDPLSASLTSQSTAVEAAYKDIQKLLTLLKTDVASATAVQITLWTTTGLKLLVVVGSFLLRIKEKYFEKQVSIAPLVTFRIVFGLLMLNSIIRFWSRGWVASVYVKPAFHFTYMGFGWVRSLGSTGMAILFLVMVLSAFHIMLGFFYRIAAVIFFLVFTYVAMIDVTTYLNHYYFVSLVAFILIWVPAHRNYSIDTLLWPSIKRQLVPFWCIVILRFQLAIVYVFAGLAKLHPDWLISAQPMRIWLPAKTNLPIIGKYLYQTWIAYLFSWFGAAYDSLIVIFLLNKKTRPIAFAIVVIFHVATAIFFPAIGMFPYIMIASSLIFFSGTFHEKFLGFLPCYKKHQCVPEDLSHWFQLMHETADKVVSKTTVLKEFPKTNHSLKLWCISIYMLIQILVPLRFLLYPGPLFWTEEGYRFSWRVMLMEKSGAADFTVKDKTTRQFAKVNNKEFLTPLQEKMMSTQPDLILEYAQHLAELYRKNGMIQPEVYGEIYVTLNGKPSRLFIDSTVNLASQQLGWKHYKWVK